MWVSDVELSHAQELVLHYKLAHMMRVTPAVQGAVEEDAQGAQEVPRK